MRRGFTRPLCAAAILAASITALTAPGAGASTVTVGSVLPIEFTQQTFGQVATRFNTSLPEKGASLASPATGTIVRWRMQGAEGGPYYLRVLRPNGKGAYEAAGTSGPATPVGSGLQTFTSHIPIRAGDLIGIDPTHATDGIGIAEVPGASFAYVFPPPFDGATVAPSGTGAGAELELSAEVQPAPSVVQVSPAGGSVLGGTKVTITGEDLTGATSVAFGTEVASQFEVVSDTEITATSPRAAEPGSVDVSVTSVAGTSAIGKRTDLFTYRACVVPKLKGKTLSVVRAVLSRAHCKLGKVKGKGRVANQSPAGGRVLSPGAKVGVKLAPKRAG